ncbi:hypothetical protein ACOBV8_19310 (plasmid) [Pseudoalteromonas espejiana]
MRHLLDHDINNVQSTHDYIPLLNQLINFYHHALHSKLSSSDSEQCAASPKMAKKLLELANELVLEDESTEQIKQIKNAITESDNLEELLQAAINIISVVVKNISKERQSAQSF